MVNAVNLTPQGLVAQVKDLVTLPEAALRISRLVNDPNSTSSDIGREISNDVALTARLLRIANSPALGQQGKISDINRAITVLGLDGGAGGHPLLRRHLESIGDHGILLAA